LSFSAVFKVLKTARCSESAFSPLLILSDHLGPTVWMICLALNLPADVVAQQHTGTRPCFLTYLSDSSCID
jgi:hypothetical protein